MKSQMKVLITMVLIAASAGCTKPELAPVIAYYQYDYEYATKKYQERVEQIKKEDEKNIALVNLDLASSAIGAGDYMDAARAISDATKIMQDNQIGSLRGQASLALKQDMRYFKGEPYEQAMAFTYLGLDYYRRGDLENARAAFNLSLLADASSKDDKEEYRDDFTIGHYLIGKTYLMLRENDNMQISFDKVKKYHPGSSFADHGKLKDVNVSLFVELGCGPRKRPDLVVGSVDVIAACTYPEEYAEVYLNDKLIGKTEKVVDLNHQATTSGSSGRDVAQAGKGVAIAVARNIPMFGALIGAVADATGVGHADIRFWNKLPGEIHVLEAKVPPGLYTLQVKFYEKGGAELERYRQTHYYINVKEKESYSWIIKSGVDRHNLLREQSAKYLQAVAIGNAGVNQRGNLNDMGGGEIPKN